jgi:hypothetical protein
LLTDREQTTPDRIDHHRRSRVLNSSRRGYAQLPSFIEALSARHFAVAHQARWSTTRRTSQIINWDIQVSAASAARHGPSEPLAASRRHAATTMPAVLFAACSLTSKPRPVSQILDVFRRLYNRHGRRGEAPIIEEA